jgi:thymidylate kinase
MVVLVIEKTNLICFTGVDGSGKTTHAKRLLDFLQEKGYSCCYTWAGSKPIFAYLFLGATRMLGYWKTVKKGDWMDPLEKAPRKIRERLGVLYRILLYIDFEITTSIKIRIPLSSGKIVICDRYVYDLMMELMLSNLYTSKYGKLLLRTTPCPKKVFFADAKLDLIIQRRPDSNRLRVLAKRNVYRKLAQALGFRIIDTQTTFETNQEQIRRETDLLLKH